MTTPITAPDPYLSPMGRGRERSKAGEGRECCIRPKGGPHPSPLPIGEREVVFTLPLPVAEKEVVFTLPLPVAEREIVFTLPLPVGATAFTHLIRVIGTIGYHCQESREKIFPIPTGLAIMMIAVERLPGARS